MQKLLSHAEYLTSFFLRNENKLKINYPGISIKRLFHELETFALCNNQTKQEFFRSLYIPHKNNSVNCFYEGLEKGIPLEYINSKSFFYKMDFFVNQNVLIPRFETEILVEMAVNEINRMSLGYGEKLKVADVGTGSGNIILSILCEVEQEVEAIAIDLSSKALETARRNYFLHKFKIPKRSNLKFFQGDRLFGLNEKQHLIVSNPPYIKSKSDWDTVHHQVQQFGPKEALFLDDDGYFEWFQLLLQQVSENLENNGVFLMEGHEKHLPILKEMACAMGHFDVHLIKDYTGNDRFLKVDLKDI